MADFPSTPITGQTYTYGGTTYTWNGEKWVISPGANIQKTNVLPYGENIDLSAGSVHKLTTNVGDYISFVNIPPGSSKWTVEIDISDVSKYDIISASSTAFVNTRALSDTSSGQTFFRPDGSQLFSVGASNDRVYTYNLSTPWNIASANTGSFFSVAGYDATPQALTFSPDGKYMYVGGQSTKTIYQFTLGTSWDVTTSSLLNTKSIIEIPYAMKFKPDGTRMFTLYLSGTNQGILKEYQLSTAWDITTATSTGNTPVGAQATGLATGFDISANGRRVFMIGSSADTVHQYVLSTPWQANTSGAVVAGGTYSQPTTGLEGSPTSVVFNSDGSQMFISGTTGTNTIKEVKTSYSGKNYTGTFTFPANVKWAGEAAPTISANTECIIDFYTPDGGTTIYGIPKFNRVI